MTDPAMAPDIDRLLSTAGVPAMSGSLVHRIVAEAMRADRAALPPAVPRRSRGRWARHGVRGAIVAASLMLATAVAAAFGGGAPIFARIATVAQHVVEHIRHPFGHAVPIAGPVRAPVTHRMTVPPSAIATTPHGGVPMIAPQPLVGTPPMIRRTSTAPIPVIHARPMPIARSDHAGAVARPAPHPIAHRGAAASNRPPVYPLRHRPIARRSPRADAAMAKRRDGLPHTPITTPIAPRVEPAPEPVPRAAQSAFRDAGLRGDGGPRTAEPPSPPSPTGDGKGFRRPGWQRPMGGGMGLNPNGNPKPNPPGWRRLGRMGGAPHPKAPRPAGGRHRRF